MEAMDTTGKDLSMGLMGKTRISPNEKSGKHGSAQIREAPVTLYYEYLPATGTIQKPKLATPSKNQASTVSGGSSM